MDSCDTTNRMNNNLQNGDSLPPTREDHSIHIDYHEVDPVNFVNDAYNGTGGFSGKTSGNCKTFIIPNASENFFKTRVKMSLYLNYYKKFIDAQWKPIFKNINKVYLKNKQGDNYISENVFIDFCNNVTGNGIKKDDFLKAVICSAIISDVAFVSMDSLFNNNMPFLYLIKSKDVMNFTVDQNGGLSSITFFDKIIKKDGKNVYIARYIDAYKWQLLSSTDGVIFTEIEGSLVENRLNFIPVYPVWVQNNSENNYRPKPSSYDIASFGAWLYDKGSKLDYLIDKQAHGLLAMQGNIDSVPNGVDNALVIGESSSSVFPPQFLSPNPSFPKIHSDRIDQVVNAMFDIMEESGVSVQPTGSVGESGIAKSFTFSASNNRLKEVVVVLKSLDEWIYNAFKVFTGDNSDFLCFTEYPTDFTPKQPLNTDQTIRLIDLFGEEGLLSHKKMMLKMIVQMVNPMLTKEEEIILTKELSEKYEQVD